MNIFAVYHKYIYMLVHVQLLMTFYLILLSYKATDNNETRSSFKNVLVCALYCGPESLERLK